MSEWWHGEKIERRILAIEDTSDCATCQRRDSEQFEILREVKCGLLTGLTCPECYRLIDVFVQAEAQP